MIRTRDLWWWAAWFGVLSGLGQAAMQGGVSLTTGRLVFADANVVWMAPVADTALFVLVAAALLLFARRLSRTAVARVALWSFLFLSFLGPLLSVPRVYLYAKAVLAAGLAWQGARLVLPRVDLFDAIVKRSLPWLVALCVAMGFGLHLSREASARWAERSLTAAPSGAPNVILIVLDTVRAQNLGLYGYDRPTSPRLDAFSRRGVVFERAISTSPWTLPSHASLFTGRLPHELSADWLSPLNTEHPTVAEAFAARGYATVGVTANLLYTTKASGLARGFVRYDDFPASPQVVIEHAWLTQALTGSLRGAVDGVARSEFKRASDVNDEFLSWIAARPPAPFFAFLNYQDAHDPYRAPEPFDTTFGTGREVQQADDRLWRPEDAQPLMDAYDGELAYLDEQLGRLFDELSRRRILENTVMVVTADHGEQFGEHDLFGHANSLFRPLLHVPLVIVFPPSVPSGRRIQTPVSLVDVAATILDIAGNPSAMGIPGRSLAEHWRSPEPLPDRALFSSVSQGINQRSAFPASRGPMHSVVNGGMHYIRNGDGQEELYDFDRDPGERENLAGRREAAAALDTARRALAVVAGIRK